MKNPEINELARAAESLSVEKRVAAILALAELKTQDAARILIELFQNTGWRETKRLILFQLSAFLKFDRVFFFLAQHFVESDDLPLKIWILNSFKYSRSNRHDFFLKTLFEQENNELLKSQILDTLISLNSVYSQELLGQFFEVQKIAWAQIRQINTIRETQSIFEKIPQHLQLLLCKWIGNSRSIPLRPVLQGLAESPNTHLANFAYINLLKVSPLSAWPHFKMSLQDPVREEFAQLYHENNFLSQSASLEKSLDLIFKVEGESSENHTTFVQHLKFFDRAEIKNYLSLYEQPENALRYLTVLEVVFENDPHLADEVIKVIQKFPSPGCCAAALNILNRLNKKLSASDIIKWGVPDVFCEVEFLDGFNLPTDSTQWIEFYQQEFLKETKASTEKINIINFWVRAFYTFPKSHKTLSLIQKSLEFCFETLFKAPNLDNRPLLQRLLRALGQLQISSGVFFKYFQQVYEASETSWAEKNGLLANLPRASRSQKIVQGLLDSHFLNANTKLAPTNEIALLRAAFFQRCDFSSKHWPQIVARVNSANRLDVIKLSYLCPCPLAKEFLKNIFGLQSSLSYLEKKWLIKALAKYPDSDSIMMLENFLQDTDETLLGLALYSLNLLDQDKAIKLLWSEFEKRVLTHSNDSLTLQIINRLKIPKSERESLIGKAQKLLAEAKQESLIEAIHRYLDRLQENVEVPIGLKSTELEDQLDLHIVKQLPCYKELGKTVQSVLRSAEMPVTHPELFSSFVDKSTSILQFIKALDIFLKERVGPMLAGATALSRMQALILGAGLDRMMHPKYSYESGYSTEAQEIVEQLDLGQTFKANEFPLGKFKNMIHAIGSNRIHQEEFKIIDGIKAWALLLLLFARPWGRQMQVRPLINPRPLKTSSIEKVCKQLIELQDFRNPIAHRHTILEMLPIENIQRRSYKLLGELNALF